MTVAIGTESDRKSLTAPVGNPTHSVPFPEQNGQLTLPVPGAVSPPAVGVVIPPAGAKEITELTAGRPLPGPVAPADLPATPLVEAAGQKPQSTPSTAKKFEATPAAEVYSSGSVALPAEAVGTVTAPVEKAAWQHGIIRLLSNEKGTSDERLSRVRAALVAAGATVGEIIAPMAGRNAVALLPYSFDPTSSRLPEINKVLQDAQVNSYGSKV